MYHPIGLMIELVEKIKIIQYLGIKNQLPLTGISYDFARDVMYDF